MIKQWDLFTETANSRRADSIRVSLSKRSIFAINQLGYEALDKAEAVELLYDKVNKLIGMRKCSLELPNAFKLRQQGKSKSYYVRARAFCTFYKIKVKNTVVFDDVEVDEDGILTLDMTKTTDVSPRKARTTQAESKEESNEEKREEKKEEKVQPFILGA